MFARKWCVAATTAVAAALGVGGATAAVAAPVVAPVSVDRPADHTSSLARPDLSPVRVHDAGLHIAPVAPQQLQAPGAVRLTPISGGLRLDFYDTNAGSATYRVTYRTPTGTEVITRDLGTQTSYTATGLISGVSYTFAVTSMRDGSSTTTLAAKQTR